MRNFLPFFRHSRTATVCFLALSASLLPKIVMADPGPALTIDAGADRHPISPDIYGLNDNPWDPALGKEIGVPVSRWGGDAATCYNWQEDASNSGADWYFMAGGGKPGAVTPSGGPDAFVTKVKAVGGKALLTIPVIDFIDSTKASDWDCSFPVSLLGPQKDHNPYVHPTVNGQQTDAGTGQKPDGTNIVLTQDQIRRVYMPNTPAYEQTWIQHLVQRFGKASGGGVAIYQMDNEPGGWANTHRDIHPNDPTYPEIVEKTLPYARIVKETDPTALVDGPGDFGWAVYKGDPAKNGGLWNAEYYLQQFQSASQKSGHRLLDYFDEHYYPIAQDDALRFESTRSLWDPTYVEKDWIGQYNGPINLIPRMHAWVNKYYPGTKLAITEYNWNLGGTQTVVDGLVEADVLGIFGREGLDLATMWGPPGPDQPAAYAFRIYRNYDGHGGKYGSIWVHSASADQGRLAVYGALRQSDGALTLVVINKTETPLSSALALSHFKPGLQAQIYRYSGDDPKSIVHLPDQAVKPSGWTATYPARSVTLVVIPKSA